MYSMTLQDSAMDKSTKETELGVVRIEFSITIKALKSDVWEAFSKHIGTWWHKDFYMLGEGGKVVLEPWAGGRLYEENDLGNSLLWYNVIWVLKDEQINFSGNIVPPYGGPATTLLSVSLSEGETGTTILKITDSIYGVVSEKHKSDTESGWKMIFEDSLKPFVEAQ
jgi:hypothetical protein